MTMPMREKIARAIADQIGFDYDKVFEHKQEWVAAGGMRDGRFHDVNEPYRSDFDCAVDAVLEALMEPTGDMMKEGADASPMWDTSNADVYAIAVNDVADIFRAMIQAARDGK